MEHDKERLKQVAKSKITTTMVGALASFENRFGRLWGHEKEEGEDLTPQEERFYEIWQDVREEILDRGNAQIGGFNQEADSYNIEKTRYQVKFIQRRQDGRN